MQSLTHSLTQWYTNRPHPPRSFWLVGTGLLVLTLLMAFPTVNLTVFQSINHFAYFNLNHQLLAHITELGDGGIAILFFMLLCVWQLALSKRFLTATLISAILIHYLKEMIDASRPPAILEPMKAMFPVGNVYLQDSFPSGHSATVFIVAGIVWLSFANKKWSTILLGVAVIVALSRVAIGIHWPVDITAGALLGWLLAYVCVLLSQTPYRDGINRTILIVISVLTSYAVLEIPVDFPNLQSVILFRKGVSVTLILLCLYQLTMLIRDLRQRHTH